LIVFLRSQRGRALFGYGELPNFPPRYNVAPTQPIPIVRLVDGKRSFALMRWGLMPSWVKDPKTFPLLINARGESVLEKPAFPTTSRPRLAGTAMEISRFPCQRLLRMPGSTTTRGRHVSCDIDTGRVAFCGTENISTPNLSHAAQYLACALPYERFTSAFVDNPYLRASAVRCSFTVTDFHRLPFAGLPAHPSTHDPTEILRTIVVATLSG
jgi:hypothetical protein